MPSSNNLTVKCLVMFAKTQTCVKNNAVESMEQHTTASFPA